MPYPYRTPIPQNIRLQEISPLLQIAFVGGGFNRGANPPIVDLPHSVHPCGFRSPRSMPQRNSLQVAILLL